MADPSTPLRLKREAFCLYLANQYGVSAAYSSVGYSYKSREHLSKNAGTLAANAAIIARVKWLKEHPQEAAHLLDAYVANRNKQDAQSRSQVLTKALAKRRAVMAKRAAPTPPQAPTDKADEASLLSLLHFCQSEAKEVYERSKLERADPMIVKNALGAHRDFTVSLHKYRNDAKQVGNKSAAAGISASALNIYSNMCASVDESPPVLVGTDMPIFASVEETEGSHDEAELRYNVAQTLNQYDLLVEATNRPDMRVQLQLLEVLGKSTQRLITLQILRSARGKGCEYPQSNNFVIDPSVVTRWAEKYEVSR